MLAALLAAEINCKRFELNRDRVEIVQSFQIGSVLMAIGKEGRSCDIESSF